MKKYLFLLSIIAGILIILASCKKNPTSDPNAPASVSELSAGIETVFDQSSAAFGNDFSIISPGLEHIHDMGKVVFNKIFSPPPGYAYTYFTGLGPIYNNNSCNACHAGGGEGNPPPGGGDVLISMVFKISSGNNNTTGPTAGPIAFNGYGGQLQNNAIADIQPEGTFNIVYQPFNFEFADGSSFPGQLPIYTATNFYLGDPVGLFYSPRVAPRLVGLGYLEVLTEEQITANQGHYPITDTTHINGQPNYVYDYTTQSMQLGRFGWKCEAPSLKQQLCDAYKEDMGVTNSVFSVESSYGQPQYTTYARVLKDSAGDPSPELPDSELYTNLFYIQTLAVPAFRNGSDPLVIQGDSIFNSAGAQCAQCHIPTFTTPSYFSYIDPQPETAPTLLNTVIHPYTDMLLHNMGPSLSDKRATFSAQGFQWRTPPLWGIGLLPIINPQGQFLHDGRAKTLTEAILWHGGEARTAQQCFVHLSAEKRTALLAFLQSL